MPATDGFNPENPYGSAATVVAAPGPGPAVDGVVHQADTTTVQFDQPDPVAPVVAPVADPAAPVAPVAPAAPVAPVAPGAPAPAADMPPGGFDKFYNKDTKAYNWEAHAREADFRAAQRTPRPGIRPVAPGAPAPAGDAAAQAAVADAGLDWQSLATTIQANGTLDPAQYAALDKAGIPADIVDGYLGAVKSVGSLAADAALRYVGGTNDSVANQAAMDGLLDWAGNNLTEAEIDQHDALLNSPNWRISVDALTALRGVQPAPAGAQPLPLMGANTASAAGDGAFKDFNDQIKAQRDPRYSSDENFRQEVIRRIGLSFRG